MPKLKHSKNLAEFKKIARNLARSLKGGEVIGLIGDLGAGKTTLTQFLASELGVKEKVNSPTFVLMKIYQAGALLKRSRVAAGKQAGDGIKTLMHLDAYRLTDAAELKNIGLPEYLGQPDTVVVIEWADRVKEILPVGSIIINIKEGKGEERMIEIS